MNFKNFEEGLSTRGALKKDCRIFFALSENEDFLLLKHYKQCLKLNFKIF